jgi:tetratricopeptide (TPR) repeat protein
VTIKKFVMPVLLLLFLSGMIISSTGCNIFGWTSNDDNVGGHIAKGQRYMRDGKYADARNEFALAIQEDPASADARYYHAKATVLAAGVNVGTVIEELESADSEDQLPLYSRDPNLTVQEDIDLKNNLYQANMEAYNDLLEIYEGRATGNFNADDISVDLLVALSVTGLTGLRDTDRDGDIDDNDLYFSINSLANGQYSFGGINQFFNYNPGGAGAVANFDTTGAHYFNVLLAWAQDILTNHRTELIDILLRINPELDVDEINNLLDDIVDTIMKYYVNTGGTGNPGIGDNDHDGVVDEEHWGDTTNPNRDNDDYDWEDATCIY